ncbi:MAG TPA: UPF0182 family protein [Pseudonocardiaceae bacterium]
MATRPAAGMPKLSRRSWILIGIGIALLIVLISGSPLLSTYISWQWFGEVGYRGVFNTIVLTRVALFFVVGFLVGGTLALNLVVAFRTRPVFVPVTGSDDPLSRYRSTISRRLKLFGIGLPLVIGLICGAAGQGSWQLVQLAFHGSGFGTTDPVFHIDIGFYAFTLPLILWLKNWLFITVTISFFGALIAQYLFGGIRFAGRGGQLSTSARAQLAALIGLFVLLKAFAYFTDRYELLDADSSSQFTGATYTDLNALMPAKLILLCIAVFCALGFFAGMFLRNLQLPAIALVLLLLSSVLLGTAWPAVMQQFSVNANANQKEATSIQRNMQATTQAYGLTSNKISYVNYNPASADLTPDLVNSDQGTIPNIRVLDPNVLSATFTQQTHGRNIYGFPSTLNIDRYAINGTTQDYIVAAREINPQSLTGGQQSWFNEHMVYTHGDGFFAAQANEVDSGGYPVYAISDSANKGDGPIKVSQTGIYYGLLDNDYAIVGSNPGTAPVEYDTDTQKSTYNGSGGVSLSSWFNKLAFAMYYGDRNILFSDQIGDQSKIIFNRNPLDRVSEVAPWLTVDGSPYPAVVTDSDGANRIAWIVDAYTTLPDYPYSQHESLAAVTGDSLTGVAERGQSDQDIGYIRNSVKAVVDAYSGKVTLYSVDDSDPVLQAWEKVFPGLVQPSSQIPAALAEHFRYPQDLFKIQRDLLSRYHVTNPQDFYSAKGYWSVPNDPTKGGDTATTATTASAVDGQANLPPYYVTAQAPGQSQSEFQLESPLTSFQSQNLAAWVSVSSDPSNYGHFTVLTLPTDTSTQGPVQMQNQFESTGKVTQARTLYNNSKVTLTFGNLLTLPIGGGILYIEPVYIQQNNATGYPQLVDVLAGFNGQVGFEPGLQDALNDLAKASAAAPAAPNTPSAAPSPTTTTTTPSTTPPAAANPSLVQAVNAISQALNDLQAAQKAGDYAAIGKAYQELQTAINQFNTAKDNAGSSTAPAAPSPTPSR